MGTASCKNSKSPPQTQQKENNKNITIGVFGLDDAGKTSTVKAIEGAPSNNVQPTISSISTMIPHPLNEKNAHIDKNKNQQRIQIIDVSGARKYRQQSWSQYYDQIHGLIFVIDASEKDRLNENQETLEDLLGNEKLKNKPILILANKQDQKGAIKNEHDLKRQLDIERLKTKYKIELCTALPQKNKNKIDESIRKGFTWLIRTIDENYTELNLRVTKAKNNPINKKFNRFESDENDSDNKYSREKNTNYTNKNTDYRLKITSEKLPSISINKNKAKVYSDDDDNDHNYLSTTNGFNKKKKTIGGTSNHNTSIKKSSDNEPKAFRSTYEPFPEETPWSSSPILKSSKSDDMLLRLNTKSSLTSDIKRRDVSPLVHDTKSYTTGSLSKRNNGSDDEDDFNRQNKSKSTSRFDNSSVSTNRFSSNIKKTTSGIYGDDDDYYKNTTNYRTSTTTNKLYNRDDDNDDDENNYLKKSTTTKSNKNYGFDDNKNYQRSSDRLNLNSEYRGTLPKPANRSKHDDDDYYSTSKPITRSTYNNDYSTSKTTNRSTYNDDDDHHRWSSSKPTTGSKYDDDDDYYPSSSSKITTRSKYDNEDRSYTSSKPISRSKFEDDDYPSSKSAGHSKYDDDDDDYYPSSSKTVTRSKYDDDDDDDDYPNSSKKTNYNGSSGSRSRYENDDFFTSKGGSTHTNRFKKTTDYDS